MTHYSKVQVYSGAAARQATADPVLLQAWQSLWHSCSWATAFQRPDYCTAWYAAYASTFEPLLVIERDKHGNAQGIFPLAVGRGDGTIVGAGAHQAEYQGWLCVPEDSGQFPLASFDALLRGQRNSQVHLKYLPPGTPLEWLHRSDLISYTQVTTSGRPILRPNPDAKHGSSLRKSSNKSKLNRIARAGEIRFERIATREQLAALLPTIAVHCDLRQAAVNGVMPFRQDPQKLRFHLELMSCPHLLHVTVLSAGNTLVSAHIGYCNGRSVSLGITAQNPAMAAHSPGKLHLLMLADLLWKEGYTELDLTPGGDPYKDRFATSTDTVSGLRVYRSATRVAALRAASRVTSTIRRSARSVGITPAAIRRLSERMKPGNLIRLPGRLVAQSLRWFHDHTEVRIYCAARPSAPSSLDDGKVHRDAWSDFLLVRPAGAREERYRFIEASLRKLAADEHCFTVTSVDRLLQCGWLVERQDGPVGVAQDLRLRLPANSAYLHDFYADPDVSSSNVFVPMLKRMIDDAFLCRGIERAYAIVAAADGPLCRAIESAGFAHIGSVDCRTRCGRITPRADAIIALETDDANGGRELK